MIDITFDITYNIQSFEDCMKPLRDEIDSMVNRMLFSAIHRQELSRRDAMLDEFLVSGAMMRDLSVTAIKHPMIKFDICNPRDTFEFTFHEWRIT